MSKSGQTHPPYQTVQKMELSQIGHLSDLRQSLAAYAGEDWPPYNVWSTVNDMSLAGIGQMADFGQTHPQGGHRVRPPPRAADGAQGPSGGGRGGRGVSAPPAPARAFLRPSSRLMRASAVMTRERAS